MKIESQIHDLLDRIERHHSVRILYACESGSRAWGFASPDSDYDIRFVFARGRHRYLSVEEGLESIDLPLENGLLDAGGWDLRKAARLLGKSNGALVEWLHSPIVYREAEGFRARWRRVAREVFAPRASVDHYRGLAKQMIHGKLDADSVRAKDYLYVLRALLAALWVSRQFTPPPVAFAELVPLASPEVLEVLPALLEHKARSGEGDRIPHIPELDRFFTAAMDELDVRRTSLPRSPDTMAALDRLLRAEISAFSASGLGKEDLTLERVRRPDLLLFDTVAGSRAYGTNVEGSDEDRRGVFVMPRDLLFGLDGIEQVADERGDEVYYELGTFTTLLARNNPNALELLAMPEDCVRYRNPLYDLLTQELFLSKLCATTFGEYAMGQIRKSRGLKKKIVNPQPETRRALLEFCHVPVGQGSVPVLEWLNARGISLWECGISAVRHAEGLYAIYHEGPDGYRGIISRRDPDTLVFSSVPIEAVPLAWMQYNQDAFRAHCKAHREYWEWVENRNEERYRNNTEHGRGYDSKHLMHTLRLLEMALGIAREGVLRVRRPNRDELLRIRAGEYAYEEIVATAERKLVEMREAFETSPLPEQPDRRKINAVLREIREEFPE